MNVQYFLPVTYLCSQQGYQMMCAGSLRDQGQSRVNLTLETQRLLDLVLF